MSKLKLVNKNSIGTVEIEETTFYFQPMTAGIKAELYCTVDLTKLPQLVVTDGRRFAEVLGRVVTKVDGFEGESPVEVVGRMANFESLGKLFDAIARHSQVSEEERKNSESSSSGSTAEGTTRSLKAPMSDQEAVAEPPSASSSQE